MEKNLNKNSKHSKKQLKKKSYTFRCFIKNTIKKLQKS